MLAQTLEVKNGAGVVVPVKALDIAAGDTTAEFEFVTAVTAADLKGVWTVDGVKYDLDVYNKIVDFLEASTQIELNEALEALNLDNFDSANIKVYFEAQQKLVGTVEASELTVADIQKLVDGANAKVVEGKDEAALIKAIKDAHTANNQVAYLAALNNLGLTQVNPEWVAVATTGYFATIDGTEADLDAIQAKVNTANEAIIKTKVTDDGIDKAKLTASKELINKYAPLTDKGVINDGAIKTSLGKVEEQLAVVAVLEATTPTALKTKLAALATLVDNPVTLDMKNYVDANGKAYIAKLAETADTGKDTTGEIAGIITAVNTGEAGKLVKAVNDAASAAQVDADALLKALNDLGVKQAVAENKADYAKAGVKNVELLKTAAGTTKTKVAVQTAVDKINLLAVTEATKDTIIEKLNVFELDNVVEANAEAYEAAKADIGGVTADATGDNAKTVALVKAQVKIVNDAGAEAAQVKAINEATTATEVKAALDNLAITSYVNVPSVDKLYVAEQVLALRDTLIADRDELKVDGDAKATGTAKVATAKTFANVADLTGHFAKADTGVITKYNGLLGEFAYDKLKDTATTVTQLGKLGYDAFDKLTPAEKANVAEAFKAKYPVDKDGKQVPYTTVAAVKASVDAAIAK
jgi:hypothetical protein